MVLKRTDLEAETHAESLALADKDEQFMDVNVDDLIEDLDIDTSN